MGHILNLNIDLSSKASIIYIHQGTCTDHSNCSGADKQMPGQYFQKTDNTKKSKYLPNTVTEHAH
jgi:hypothetical protein